MRLARALDDKKLDLRLRDKLLHEGKVSKSELDNYFNSLPDDAATATTTQAVEEEKRAATASSESSEESL